MGYADTWAGKTANSSAQALGGWFTPAKADPKDIKEQQDRNLALANSLANERSATQATQAPSIEGYSLAPAPTQPGTGAAIVGFARNPGDPGVGSGGTVGTAGAPGGGWNASARPSNVVGPATQSAQTDINTRQADQTRGQQQEAITQIQQAANGTVPSAAQIQQQQGLDRAVANQYALAASLGGRTSGGALRTASQGSAQLQQAAVADAAALRATEQANARNALTNALQGVRGQDQDIAQAQAALTQGNRQFNANAQNTLQGKVLDANTQTQIANLKAQIDTMNLDQRQKEALLQAQLQAMGYAQSGANAIYSGKIEQAKADNSFKGDLIGGGGSMLAAIFSDKREKTDVRAADMSAFLDALEPYTFNYKDPSKDGAAPGKRIGILAQDAKRSKVGRSFVFEDGDRLKLDVGNALGAALAAAASLNKRVKKLESR
jgi:hypothetical protein